MFCFCRIPVALESRRSSRWGGRGGCAPPTPSPWIHSCLWTIRHSHISHNAPYLPSKILHNFCFSFLLGITAVLREIENKPYSKFWGAKNGHYGKCGSSVWNTWVWAGADYIYLNSIPTLKSGSCAWCVLSFLVFAPPHTFLVIWKISGKSVMANLALSARACGPKKTLGY